MKYQKIPLEEQLKRLDAGNFAHPEFGACAIRAWAGMPLSVYFGDTAEGKARHGELIQKLQLSPEEDTTYREAALRIQCWKQQDGDSSRAGKALCLLAEPLAAAYMAWMEVWGNG